jgi:hypothetical protein
MRESGDAPGSFPTEPGLRVVGYHRELSQRLSQELRSCGAIDIEEAVVQFVTDFERCVSHDQATLLSIDARDFMSHGLPNAKALALLERVVQRLGSNQECRFVCPSDFLSRDVLVLAEPDSDRAFPAHAAWLSNAMQRRAFDTLYSHASQESIPQELWRRLQDAEYLRDMRVEPSSVDERAATEQGFESPYDAFIYFMNVVKGAAALTASRHSGTRVAS